VAAAREAAARDVAGAAGQEEEEEEEEGGGWHTVDRRVHGGREGTVQHPGLSWAALRGCFRTARGWGWEATTSTAAGGRSPGASGAGVRPTFLLSPTMCRCLFGRQGSGAGSI
jgi:hypothetical protein